MNEENTSHAYVTVDMVDEHIEPSEHAEVVSRLDLRQRVDVFEDTNGWTRVSWYYDHYADGRKLARWVRTSSLSSDRPAPPKHGLPETRLGAALARSDNVGRYWRRFLRGAQRAIDRGLASEDDFVECGGWVRSPSSAGFYFINPDSHVRGRIYLHAPTGRMAQWHSWMDDQEVAKYLYEKQGGKCVLCRRRFPRRNLETDHIIPKRMGRIDKIGNLQLLCSACNRIKGDRSQEWAIGRLEELGEVGD